MNCCHQTSLNAEVVVQHFGDRSQAVGCARCVRNDLLTVVFVSVNTANEHVGLTAVFALLRRSRKNNIFSTGFEVFLSTVHCQIESCRFYNVLCFHFTPLDVLGVTLCEDADFFTVNYKCVLVLNFHSAVETSVHCVILKKISKIIYWQKVVDCNYLYIIYILWLKSWTEYETANTTETIDTDFNFTHNINKLSWLKTFSFNPITYLCDTQPRKLLVYPQFSDCKINIFFVFKSNYLT